MAVVAVAVAVVDIVIVVVVVVVVVGFVASGSASGWVRADPTAAEFDFRAPATGSSSGRAKTRFRPALSSCLDECSKSWQQD